jgi:putative ABC transport system permease protein
MIIRLDNSAIYDKKLQLKNELQRDPAVTSVSLMTGEPGGFHDGYTMESEGRPGDKISINTEFADFEFAKTLGIKIIAGRDLSPEFVTDSTESVLINHTAATRMGYTPEQAVGKWIKISAVDSLRRTIKGVVEDYHFTSLKQTITPLVISSGRNNDRRLALIKFKTANLQQVIERIKKMYRSAAPDYPFEYEFLDERFDQLYRSEMKQETLLTVFSVIAIGIACLGLFGLASYTAIKRTKEIGVRKVLGSSVQNIALLLSKDLMKPVLLGTVIAIPCGYIIMQKWLEDFAYRTSFNWWLFAMAAIIVLLIALFTISIQAVKAALANPVRTLRSE